MTGQLLCWDCKEPLDEDQAVKVRTNPHLPEWQSKSVTSVHEDCAYRREAMREIQIRKQALASKVSDDVKRITEELIDLYEEALRKLAKT